MQVPRLFWWLVATILLVVIIGLLAPQQLPVSLYKLSLVTMAGVVGYWLDRSLFPYARPDSFFSGMDVEDVADFKYEPWDDGDSALMLLFGIAMFRRALIVSAAMIAMGIGA